MALLAMLTVLPWRRATIPGSTAREQCTGPRKLTSRACHHWSVSVSQNGPIGPAVAALFTSKSTGPSDRSISTIALRTVKTSLTSVAKACARPPACSINRTVLSNSDCERASTAAHAPAFASASAIARPMPRPPPVTTATCPRNKILSATTFPEPRGITRLPVDCFCVVRTDTESYRLSPA